MPVVRTLGIDLSADARSTAACRLQWKRGAVTVEQVWPSQTGGAVGPDELAGLILGGEITKTGIDSPFGWPTPFIEEIVHWSQGRQWRAGDDRERLRYRETDLEVRGRPRLPLSVSTERLGATAMACARLLSELDGVDRSGLSGPVAEVYPAAALHRWGIKPTGYKQETKESRTARATVLEGLKQQLGDALSVPSEIEQRMLVEHDLLDAFVCALVAKAVEAGKTSTPAPEQEKLARIEGWIHVPTTDSPAELI